MAKTIDEIIIIHVTTEENDEGVTYPTTRVLRYEFEPKGASEMMARFQELAGIKSIEGGQMSNI